MKATVADFILERLRGWGVEHVFAYPGDGINGLLAAWGRADNQPVFVQARHEEMAAFEAVGYAKFSGKIGVCAATSGPGAIHLLNGLYDALLDHVPVVAIVGQTSRSAMGGSYQQEVDLLSLFKDVCHSYVQMVTVPQQLPNVLDRAIRTAHSQHAPTCIIVPSDVQELKYEPPEHEFKMVPSSIGTSWPQVAPDDAAVAQAADILNAGERVAILIGQGARGAAQEITALADLLGAGVAKALLGKDVLADDLPFVTGSIGLLGTRPSYELMMGCDTLLSVGTNFPYTQFMPELEQARAIQVDIDGSRIGMRYPYELNLVGDARATLQALLPLVTRKSDRSWRDGIESSISHWRNTVERQAMTDSGRPDTVNPMRLVWELSQHTPSNAIICADSGSAANWYARHLSMRGEMRGSLSGTLATMGPGVPYVIGAKFAHPDRPAIALVGDGAMQMNGMAELITIARYWRGWDDPRLVVAILHNNDLNQVTWEMRAMEGAPKFAESQTLPDVDYAGFATGLGLSALTITEPEKLESAWKEAFSTDRPTVLDVHTDPDVPPIPPHADFEQVKSMTKALIAGDEDAWGVIRTGVKQKVQGIPAWPEGVTMNPLFRKTPPVELSHAIENIRTGRFERSLAALAAGGAAITTAEIFMSHDGASFGNKMMWVPIAVVPTVIPAGIASVFSRKAAKTVLPLASALVVANGLQGTYLHFRGVPQKPGGRQNLRYNLEMGPPVFAPLLAAVVGGMGLLASLLRREGSND